MTRMSTAFAAPRAHTRSAKRVKMDISLNGRYHTGKATGVEGVGVSGHLAPQTQSARRL